MWLTTVTVCLVAYVAALHSLRCGAITAATPLLASNQAGEPLAADDKIDGPTSPIMYWLDEMTGPKVRYLGGSCELSSLVSISLQCRVSTAYLGDSCTSCTQREWI